MRAPSRRGLLLAVLGLTFIDPSAANCECGYSVTTGGNDEDASTQLFTDLLESDFVHVDYVGADSQGRKGWAAQEYNKSGTDARGPYGEAFVLENVKGSLLADAGAWTGNGSGGGDAGLQLTVGSEVMGGMVLSAEAATTGLDYLYGSYRVGMKVTDVPGTCSAFFWYFNDTQEVNIEFLSADFDADTSTYPVNLGLQTPESRASGYNASQAGTFATHNLPFDPSADFHEYRFDLLADRVLFYADGALLATMANNRSSSSSSTDGGAVVVPSEPGNLLLSHWSNGDPDRSRGPPPADATTAVRYVKAYYNSTAAGRRADLAARCADPTGPAAVCAVPEGDATFFFAYQANMTVNQTTYAAGDSAAGRTEAPASAAVALLGTLAVVMWACLS
ncbi:hypothetical protein JX265_009272 [Neoarthrinium moseri]|uniref:GH16 domain-containing protein n=1 Tax=Neoarthrinium moseri TaxID=1658444 RepID=A0A9Q0AJK1_9PEZI|nr:hypothetical protein JX265_009272 [Neoarthrinium moseri]